MHDFCAFSIFSSFPIFQDHTFFKLSTSLIPSTLYSLPNMCSSCFFDFSLPVSRQTHASHNLDGFTSTNSFCKLKFLKNFYITKDQDNKIYITKLPSEKIIVEFWQENRDTLNSCAKSSRLPCDSKSFGFPECRGRQRHHLQENSIITSIRPFLVLLLKILNFSILALGSLIR